MNKTVETKIVLELSPLRNLLQKKVLFPLCCFKVRTYTNSERLCVDGKYGDVCHTNIIYNLNERLKWRTMYTKNNLYRKMVCRLSFSIKYPHILFMDSFKHISIDTIGWLLWGISLCYRSILAQNWL